MNMDNFEHKAKNLFEHYQPESENDQIWNHIEPHLKKKKKRRFIIWFFVGAGLDRFNRLARLSSGTPTAAGPRGRMGSFDRARAAGPVRARHYGATDAPEPAASEAHEVPRVGFTYYFGRAVLVPLARLFYRPRIEGRRNIPRTGKVILASNHLSFIDSLIIPMFAPRRTPPCLTA